MHLSKTAKGRILVLIVQDLFYLRRIINQNCSTKLMIAQKSQIVAEPIKQIEIFYYSSMQSIFENTVLIELSRKFPKDITVRKSQLSEPNHPQFGHLPVCLVNGRKVIKRQSLWDFIALALEMRPADKLQFLAVAQLSEELAHVSALQCEYDPNPYFMFISPWRKYKRHLQLSADKVLFKETTHYYDPKDDSLRTSYLTERVGHLKRVCDQYQGNRNRNSEIYRLLVFSFLKQVKVANEPEFRDLVFKAEWAQALYDQVALSLLEGGANQPNREVSLLGVRAPNFEPKEESNEEQYSVVMEREKLFQKLFKPVFATALFALALYSFKNETLAEVPLAEGVTP